MNMDWGPVQYAFESAWRQLRILFSEYHFLTIVCAFFALMMVISFYKFLRSISPALVGFVLLLILFLLVLHWTHTRTEPAFFTPFIDWLAPFFPTAPPPANPPPTA